MSLSTKHSLFDYVLTFLSKVDRVFQKRGFSWSNFSHDWVSKNDYLTGDRLLPSLKNPNCRRTKREIPELLIANNALPRQHYVVFDDQFGKPTSRRTNRYRGLMGYFGVLTPPKYGIIDSPVVKNFLMIALPQKDILSLFWFRRFREIFTHFGGFKEKPLQFI